MFISAWTDKILNFGNHTTNRVESQHAKLKRYLDSSQSDLKASLSSIHQVVQSQDTAIKASIEHSRIVTRHQFKIPHFQELVGFVSSHALDIIFKEFERSKLEHCGCQVRTCYGLPCAHEQAQYLKKGHPIPLDSIDVFWRKLDLSPCISLKDDDSGCEVELQMLNAQFKKESRSGKASILKKLREIISPSTTSLREPMFHKTTRGRPSLKDKFSRKTFIDSSPVTHDPCRHGCSTVTNFVKQDVFEYQDPTKDNCYSTQKNTLHPYINQFPKMFHPFITDVQDVKPDGNCGFRAIAVCLGLDEDAWPSIRRNLMEELDTYKKEYVEFYGREQWCHLNDSLDFFELGKATPYKHWMTMPDMGVLIASKYNVILHVLTVAGSMTHLPLRSSPPPWYEHVAIAIGYVNNNHYVKVGLTGGYPMPTVMPQWARFRYDCAAAWTTSYMNRLNNYNQILHQNCSTESVILE